jgi:hypothetical protein
MSHSAKIILWVIVGILVISCGGILWYKYGDKAGDNDKDQEHKLPAIKLVLTNGCGFEGVANDFGDFLADKNVDIVSVGNTRLPINDKTYIVNRKGDIEDLQRLHRMTGIDRWTEARNENALAEFEIIIGKDYEEYTKK